MYKILLFGFVFSLGLVLGGGLRYAQVEAKLSGVEATTSIVPASSGALGNSGGGSCG